PGRKQVWRRYDADGRMAGDRIALERTPAAANGAESLLDCVMRDGKRLRASSLDEIRARAKRDLERLPEPLRRLAPDATYPGEIGADLVDLAALGDRRIHRSCAFAHAARKIKRGYKKHRRQNWPHLTQSATATF